MACAVLVIAAVLLEVLAGRAANSETSDWQRWLIPLAWPRLWRVLWWLLIAAAAATHRHALDALDERRRWWLAAMYGLPFVVFAGGIAMGAPWSTFH